MDMKPEQEASCLLFSFSSIVRIVTQRATLLILINAFALPAESLAAAGTEQQMREHHDRRASRIGDLVSTFEGSGVYTGALPPTGAGPCQYKSYRIGSYEVRRPAPAIELHVLHFVDDPDQKITPTTKTPPADLLARDFADKVYGTIDDRYGKPFVGEILQPIAKACTEVQAFVVKHYFSDIFYYGENLPAGNKIEKPEVPIAITNFSFKDNA